MSDHPGRMLLVMIAGLMLLLTSVAAPASPQSRGFHGGSGFRAATIRPPVVQPQSRKSCYRRRLHQLLALGHDYDLAQEEALLICG
ncbi:hypothetical protein [Bradyrhizobium elkanii]|uniref:hypothetical protein n=1 Tax=Bradyrhizobium elkanii TaxID=29448 RepID=UPI0003FDDE3C|nr:hypothetical protein [Bradyrhizobium elkanii]